MIVKAHRNWEFAIVGELCKGNFSVQIPSNKE